jgi:hypothetical protein
MRERAGAERPRAARMWKRTWMRARGFRLEGWDRMGAVRYRMIDRQFELG